MNTSSMMKAHLASNPSHKLNQLPNGHHFSRRGAILCNPHSRRHRPRPLQLAAQQQPDQQQQDISTPPPYMTRRYNKKSKWREPTWEVPYVPEVPSSEPTTSSSPLSSSQPPPPQQQLSDTLASLQSQLDQLTSAASTQITSIKSQLEHLAATTTSQLEDVTTTVSQQWTPAAVDSLSIWTNQQLATAIDQLKSIQLAVKDATQSGQSDIVSTLNEVSEMIGQHTQLLGVQVKERSKTVGEQAGQTVGKLTGDLTALSQQALEEMGRTVGEIRGAIGPQLESTLDMLREQTDVATAQIQQLGDQIKTTLSYSINSNSVSGDKTAMQQQDKNILKKVAMIIDSNNDKKTKKEKEKVVRATAPTTTTTPGPRNERYDALWNKMIELRDTTVDAVETTTAAVEDMAIKIKQTIIGTGNGNGSSKVVATKKTATIQPPLTMKKKSTISTSTSTNNSNNNIIMKTNIIRQRILSIAEPTKSTIDSVLTKIPPEAKSVATSPITAGILTVAAVAATSGRWWLMRKRAETADKRALEVEAAKRSAYLAKQRARFRAALADGGDDDTFKGSVDRSIYSAVSRIPSSSSTNSTSTSSSGTDNEEEEEEEEEDAPPVYDKETLKAWAAFVKGSKMEQGQMWVPEDVDQGMPEVHIDLNRDRDDDK